MATLQEFETGVKERYLATIQEANELLRDVRDKYKEEQLESDQVQKIIKIHSTLLFAIGPKLVETVPRLAPTIEPRKVSSTYKEIADGLKNITANLKGMHSTNLQEKVDELKTAIKELDDDIKALLTHLASPQSD